MSQTKEFERTSSASATNGDELESLLEKWQRLDPETDGSAMLVLGRLGILVAHRERAYAHVLEPFGLSLIDVHTLQLLRLMGPVPPHVPRSSFAFPSRPERE